MGLVTRYLVQKLENLKRGTGRKLGKEDRHHIPVQIQCPLTFHDKISAAAHQTEIPLINPSPHTLQKPKRAARAERKLARYMKTSFSTAYPAKRKH